MQHSRVNIQYFLWMFFLIRKIQMMVIYCGGHREKQSSCVVIRNMSLELTSHFNFSHLLQLIFFVSWVTELGKNTDC